MLNVGLAGDYMYGKLLFTWLSLVMFLMATFCAVLFHSYGFATYSFKLFLCNFLKSAEANSFNFLIMVNHIQKVCHTQYLCSKTQGQCVSAISMINIETNLM